MSLIGLLEQFNITSVLRRLESHAKTGLLIIQQGGTWVEFYFRDGMLMCIGPVRTNAHLGERLLQDGIISRQALQETMQKMASTPLTENRIALTLMDLGWVGLEDFRAWAMRKTLDVLSVLVTWTSGEIYFEDDAQAPADRLLIALSLSSLMDMLAPPQPVADTQSSAISLTGLPTQEAPRVLPPTPTSDVTRIPTVMDAAQLLAEQQGIVPPSISQPLSLFAQEPVQSSPSQSLFAKDQAPSTLSAQSLIDPQAFSPVQESSSLSAQSLIEENAFAPQAISQSLFTNDTPPVVAQESTSSLFSNAEDASSFLAMNAPQQESAQASFLPPQPVMTPPPPRFVDTSYMRPDMVLVPLDLAPFREQQASVMLTPDQWRLLTRVDGQTSLQTACQELSMRPEVVCQLAGELAADQLIQLMLPNVEAANELSPTSREFVASGLSNGYVAPGSAATTAQPWSAPVPPSLPDVASQFPSSISFETQSQWGNGGNGASFIPGRGWVAAPQSVQPMSPTNTSSVSYTDSYAHVGGGRQ